VDNAKFSPTVRVEAAIWAAHAALAALQPQRAVAWTDATTELVGQSPPAVFQRWALLRSTALAAVGRHQEATSLASVLTPDGGPTQAAQIASSARRGHHAQWAGLVLAGYLIGGMSMATRARPAPITALAPLALLVVATAGLIALWGSDAWAATLWMGAGWSVITVVSARALPGRGRTLQALLRCAAASATLAVAYLALWHTHSLAWIGR